MMSRFVCFAMIAALMALPAIAMGGDTEIAQAIVKRLQAKKAEGSLKGFNIGLRVEEGVVWLEGHVSNAEQHDMAIDVARRVAGVQKVYDGIRVEGSGATTPASGAADAEQSSLQPRELAAEELTEEALDNSEVTSEPRRIESAARQSLVLQPAREEAASAADLGGFSFSPIQYASAEKSLEESTTEATATPLKPLRPVPAANAGGAQVPLAMGQAGQPAYHVAANTRATAAAQPVPGYAPPAYYPSQYNYGYARPVRYDHPHMPGYAWPAYAAHPNYAALTYPRQYSPMAWPYIGPFYPYPQVPLGWRKVEMEWKDGWWVLDFKARRHHSF